MSLNEDECVPEVLIHPHLKNRRHPIHEAPSSEAGIIKCIGSLLVRFEEEITHAPEFQLGTGTVIKINDSNQCFILTAAHNVRAIVRQCSQCQKKTIRWRCDNKGCQQKKTNKLTPIKLINPQSIQFQRRCIVPKRTSSDGREYQFGEVEKSYEVTQCNLLQHLYKTFPSGIAGFDLAILVFNCTDENGKNIYVTETPKIKLINDPTFGDGKDIIYIYGYPADKHDTKTNTYRMYGMSTGTSMNGNEFKLQEHKQSGREYIINQQIDCTDGQSGSAIWTCKQNIFYIFGIHTGGNMKKGMKIGENYGTFLDKEWIKQIQDWICSDDEKVAQNLKRVSYNVYKDSLLLNSVGLLRDDITGEIVGSATVIQAKNGYLYTITAASNVCQWVKPFKTKLFELRQNNQKIKFWDKCTLKKTFVITDLRIHKNYPDCGYNIAVLKCGFQKGCLPDDYRIVTTEQLQYITDNILQFINEYKMLGCKIKLTNKNNNKKKNNLLRVSIAGFPKEHKGQMFGNNGVLNTETLEHTIDTSPGQIGSPIFRQKFNVDDDERNAFIQLKYIIGIHTNRVHNRGTKITKSKYVWMNKAIMEMEHNKQNNKGPIYWQEDNGNPKEICHFVSWNNGRWIIDVKKIMKSLRKVPETERADVHLTFLSCMDKLQFVSKSK